MTQPKFSQRSVEMELMDNLACSGEVVDQTLRELEFINRTLGGNSVTVDGVLKLLETSGKKTISILDLGCGGGDMLVMLNQKLIKSKTDLSFMGIDANPNIVAYASKQCQHMSFISFATLDILSQEFRQLNCDIAIATLFLHHFTNDQLIAILAGLYRQARLGIVVNDLHRHPLAYYSIKILTHLFSKSAMVKNDAPLSVLRGFSRHELKSILNQAGIKNYVIKWKWAFRWQVVVRKNPDSHRD